MKFRKKYMIFIVPIIAILILSAYSLKKYVSSKPTASNNSNNETVKSGAATVPDKNNKESVVTTVDPTNTPSKDTVADKDKPNVVDIEEVKKLVTQLNSESQVSSSQIYIENNMHIAKITFKKDADIKNAKDFATKYADLIKKVYNDKNVNVQIIQNDKSIENVVLK